MFSNHLRSRLRGIPVVLIGFKEGGSIGPFDRFKFFGSIGPKNLGAGPIGPKEDGNIREALSLFEGFIAGKYKGLMELDPIVVERHSGVIRNAFIHARQFEGTYEKVNDVAILSSEVNVLGEKVSELIGIVNPDSVLNDVFMNFCIGK